MGTLVTHHFLFTALVVSPLELDEHSGSSLRGNLFEAVWQRFCTNKAARTCAECPLHQLCPVSALVAPLREENKRGRDIPRPYVILPPLEGERRLAPGETLTFGLTLFGKIIELLPYLLLVTNSLETAGLGRHLTENRGQRGTFKIQQIEAYHPIDGTRQVISRAGKLQIEAPTLSINAADIRKRAGTFSSEKISIRFITPTRLLQQKNLVFKPAFQPFVSRLLERLSALEQEYGEDEGQSPSEQWEELRQLADQVVCVEDQTSWERVRSYSRRTHSSSEIGGFSGVATFAGNLAPFRELLAWGEQIHVGKNVVKGSGWYRVEH
jgi:hypothetical protein